MIFYFLSLLQKSKTSYKHMISNSSKTFVKASSLSFFQSLAKLCISGLKKRLYDKTLMYLLSKVHSGIFRSIRVMNGYNNLHTLQWMSPKFDILKYFRVSHSFVFNICDSNLYLIYYYIFEENSIRKRFLVRNK